jgi:hypothetical protein
VRDTDDDRSVVTRRRLLAAAGLAALGGVAATTLRDGSQRPTTETLDGETGARLARRFAPVVHFGAGERWFPTDPRQYATDRDGERVVDGFDALSGYAADTDAADGVPAPTVFWQTRRYTGTDLLVVQYWLYSAFDQFSVNFHWHDWELLQVFLDRETEEPTLFSASAHSRRVPNNEFVDPDRTRPRVVSEVGSHSSALSVRGEPDRFRRLPPSVADVTNGLFAGLDFPFAYGLPRDEGYRLPYVVPELDGTPLFDHPDLPAVERRHFLPPRLTLRDGQLPGRLPERESGVQLAFDDRTESAGYALEPIADVREIDSFDGPQLSFEFPVPGFAEDALAGHLTTVGVPWEQPRFTDPVADVTDERHRATLAERFGVGGLGPVATAGALVTRVREATADAEAPGGNGVTTRDTKTEVRALFESEPESVPSFRGVVAVLGPPAGDHRLVLDGPNTAPYAERLTHEPTEGGTETTTSPTADTETTTSPTADTETTETADTETTTSPTADTETTTSPTTDTKTTTSPTADTETTEVDDTERTKTDDTPVASGTVTTAGVDGESVLVPADEAVKLRADARGDAAADLDSLAVVDDFGGRLYQSPPADDETAAVYVHRDGAYTADVTDTEGGRGAYRVNPASDQTTATVDRVETGARSLTTYLETFLRETRAQVTALRDGESVDDAVPAAARDPAAAGGDGGDAGDDTDDQTGDTDDEKPNRGRDPVDRALARLDAAVEAARNALAAIDRGEGAAGRLGALRNQLDAIRRTLDAGDKLPAGVAPLLDRRIDRLDERVRLAVEAVSTA